MEIPLCKAQLRDCAPVLECYLDLGGRFPHLPEVTQTHPLPRLFRMGDQVKEEAVEVAMSPKLPSRGLKHWDVHFFQKLSTKLTVSLRSHKKCQVKSQAL